MEQFSSGQFNRETITDTSGFKPIKRAELLYNPKEMLGEGSRGTLVFRGCMNNNKEAVAVKRTNRGLTQKGLTEKEKGVLLKCDHENIVRYYCTETDEDFDYLVLELCLSSLRWYVDMKRDSTPCQDLNRLKGLVVVKKNIIEDAIKGIEYLHKLHIIHRDIKPENVLLTQRTPSSNEVKAVISDFGISCMVKNGNTGATTLQARGTYSWIAPEIVPNRKCSYAADIFAMGCLIYYILSTGYHPFGKPDTPEYQCQSNIASEKYQFSLSMLEGDEEGKAAKNLIELMISRDKTSRPPASEVLSHCYFWSNEKKLDYLNCVSRWISDTRKNDPHGLYPCVHSQIEEDAVLVIGNKNDNSWVDKITEEAEQELTSQGEYCITSLEDLLKVIRTKREQYNELSDNVKAIVGAPPDDFLAYFTSRFPSLLIHTYKKMEMYGTSDAKLNSYYPEADTRSLFAKIKEMENDMKDLQKRLTENEKKSQQDLSAKAITIREWQTEYQKLKADLSEKDKIIAKHVKSHYQPTQTKESRVQDFYAWKTMVPGVLIISSIVIGVLAIIFGVLNKSGIVHAVHWMNDSGFGMPYIVTTGSGFQQQVDVSLSLANFNYDDIPKGYKLVSPTYKVTASREVHEPVIMTVKHNAIISSSNLAHSLSVLHQRDDGSVEILKGIAALNSSYIMFQLTELCSITIIGLQNIPVLHTFKFYQWKHNSVRTIRIVISQPGVPEKNYEEEGWIADSSHGSPIIAVLRKNTVVLDIHTVGCWEYSELNPFDHEVDLTMFNTTPVDVMMKYIPNCNSNDSESMIIIEDLTQSIHFKTFVIATKAIQKYQKMIVYLFLIGEALVLFLAFIGYRYFGYNGQKTFWTLFVCSVAISIVCFCLYKSTYDDGQQLMVWLKNPWTATAGVIIVLTAIIIYSIITENYTYIITIAERVLGISRR